jgi:hypothetical protein
MIDAVRPEVDMLGRQLLAFNSASPRRDVVLFLPCRGWLDSDVCKASALAAELSQANLQYEVLCEDDFRLPRLQGARVSLVEGVSVLNAEEKAIVKEFCQGGGAVIAADNKDWMRQIKQHVGTPAVTVQAPATVRAVVRDQPRRTLVHLLNLNVVRRSSYEDEVHRAENVRLTVRVPFSSGCTVRAITADAEGTSGDLPTEFHHESDANAVAFTIPRLIVAAVLVIEPNTKPSDGR